MDKLLIFLIIIFLFTSCTKEVFVNQEPENKDYGQPPENFELNIGKVTDSEIIISWTDAIDPENENVTYEVTLFDSVVIYGLTNKYYDLLNLMPNTDYTIGVNAIDESLNKKSVSQNIKTKESLLKEAYWYDLGFNFDYDLTHAIKTSDNGILFAGRKLERYGIQFLLKLNSDFEIQWIKEFDWNYMDYINELIELNDNNYLILRKESLTKVDTHGNQIWTYLIDNNTTVTTINSGYETESGELIITGTTDINRELNENINLEAFISKISSSGELIWLKYFGTTYKNGAETIIQKPNGNILVSGTVTHKFPENRDIDYSLWLIETDLNGNLVNDSILINKFYGTDIPKEIFIWNENDILICGSTHAKMGQYGYYNFIPRILNLSVQNEILWDFYPEITETLGVFPTFDGMISLSSNDFTFFSNLDRGVYVGTVNSSKEITWDLKLRAFPPALFMTYTNSGDIAFFTMNGDLLMLNPNGYVE